MRQQRWPSWCFFASFPLNRNSGPHRQPDQLKATDQNQKIGRGLSSTGNISKKKFHGISFLSWVPYLAISLSLVYDDGFIAISNIVFNIRCGIRHIWRLQNIRPVSLAGERLEEFENAAAIRPALGYRHNDDVTHWNRFQLCNSQHPPAHSGWNGKQLQRLGHNVAINFGFDSMQGRATEVNPLFLLVPAAATCSYGFMLPVSTPSNAIVFTAAKMNPIEMVIYLATNNFL